MKILYGVQATGQGHISRARAMARAFKDLDVDVTWLFSGRDRDKLFGMKPFGNFMHRRGLSFRTEGGKVDILSTVLSNNVPRFILDVTRLNIEQYDWVVTDFEPVTAWAAQTAGVRAIGIGHQYAFGPTTPLSGETWLTSQILSHFAPVATPIGLHWYPYAEHVMPPILDLPTLDDTQDDYILVYLPFEDQEEVLSWLQQFPQHQFKLYAGNLAIKRVGNVDCFKSNTDGFKYHLRACRGVICNSGFELISECLQWGKPVLTKPLLGQMEQSSNATALDRLGYAKTIRSLSHEALGSWLETRKFIPDIHFPNVADVLAKWLANDCTDDLTAIGRDLWRQTSTLDLAAIETTRPSTATEALARPPEYSDNAPLTQPVRSQSWHSSAL